MFVEAVKRLVEIQEYTLTELSDKELSALEYVLSNASFDLSTGDYYHDTVNDLLDRIRAFER